jgi:hypothetical protein
MTINNKFTPIQQHNIRSHIRNSDLSTFFNLLNTSDLSLTIDDTLPKHRKRSYPPLTTLSMFLTQALNPDRSCQNIVNMVAIESIKSGSPQLSTLTGGYCRARQRLPIKMVSNLVCKTGQLTDHLIPNQWRWHGKRVYLIDGTTLTMPDTKENQAVYPQQATQKTGIGFPICRVVGVICLSSGSIINASIGQYKGKGGSEQALLRQLLDTFSPGDLVLGDALYGSYFLLCSLLRQGVDLVFEQIGARKSTIDFNKGEYLGINDHLIQLKKPKRKPEWMTDDEYEQHPDSLCIREVKVAGKVLITNQFSVESVSKSDLKSLYKKRWNIEVDFRNIKSTLGLGILSCKTPAMNEKEIWVYFLAYNLIRLLIVQAALHANLLPRQLSFKHSLQLWIAFSNYNDPNDLEARKNSLFILIAERKIANRPGRIEPRAVKRRPKPFPLLMQARAVAREEIKQNGHPKKLK